MPEHRDHSTQTIRFLLDGEVITPPPLPPDTTLLNYLREHLDRKGTKEGCAEGDCGACTVVVADSCNDRLRYRAVNACIQFLPTLDGKALYTVESLQSGTQLHPAQQAMFDCHASQCGFCTPGFVMSLFALYQTEASADREQISNALSGNLCRCTGYRPILEAGQRMYDYTDSTRHALPQSQTKLLAALQDLQNKQQSLALEHRGQRFFSPTSTAELAVLVQQYPDATILAGGTDVGLWVTKQYRELPTLIYLGKVRELDYVHINENSIEIGAVTTLEDAYRALVQHYPELDDLHLRFASPPIRNAGTFVGNVANGSPIGDSMPALIALNSSVVLRRGEKQRELPLDAFYLDYQKKDLQAGEFVESVRVPLPQSIPDKPQYFRNWKISKRFEQDISAVCAAFHVTLHENNTVSAIRICLGGMAAIPKRANKTEAFLTGAKWNKATLDQAILVMAQDFKPLTDMRASSQYRSKVAQNLLFKFYLETTEDGQ